MRSRARRSIAAWFRCCARPRRDLQREPAFLAPRSWFGPSYPFPSWTSPADVDDHRLDHRELLERVLAADAPDAALGSGSTAERQMHLPIVRRIVDDHVADAEPFRDREGSADVAGEDSAREPPAAERGKFGRLVLTVEGGDRRDRAEGLLGEDPHRGGDLGQHGRLEVPGRREATDRPAIAECAGPLRNRILDVLLHLLSRLIEMER